MVAVRDSHLTNPEDFDDDRIVLSLPSFGVWYLYIEMEEDMDVGTMPNKTSRPPRCSTWTSMICRT